MRTKFEMLLNKIPVDGMEDDVTAEKLTPKQESAMDNALKEAQERKRQEWLSKI